MAEFALSMGDTGEDVRTLQRLLASAGYKLETDGVYGENTRAAVSEYQKANSLAQSGEAGATTWAKLAGNAVVSLPKGTSAAKRVAYLQDNRPKAYASEYTRQIDELLEKVLNREAFEYDPATDENYKRYRDQYAYLGERAYRDARGSAAALSGGYDNSFAETAGQQAYQNSMAQAAGAIPDLYKLALSAYEAEGDNSFDALSALSKAEDANYGRYRDDVDAYEQALKYYAGQAKEEKKNRASASADSGGAKRADADAKAAFNPAFLLTQTEFTRRKASGAASLRAFDTYDAYVAAMRKKYGG